jgi:hypothetical protein
MSAQIFSLIPTYSSPHFWLSYQTSDRETLIEMQMKSKIWSTQDLPQTSVFLNQKFPSVMQTRCFNENNLPFKEEVKNTEMGHLFEHVLLQNLYLIKSSAGHKQVTFNGRTYWNWGEHAQGHFKIVIDSGISDSAYFASALENTIELTEDLFLTAQVTAPIRVAFNQLPVSANAVTI